MRKQTIAFANCNLIFAISFRIIQWMKLVDNEKAKKSVYFFQWTRHNTLSLFKIVNQKEKPEKLYICCELPSYIVCKLKKMA